MVSTRCKGYMSSMPGEISRVGFRGGLELHASNLGGEGLWVEPCRGLSGELLRCASQGTKRETLKGTLGVI